MSANFRVVTVMAGNLVADAPISPSATNNPAITVTARMFSGMPLVVPVDAVKRCVVRRLGPLGPGPHDRHRPSDVERSPLLRQRVEALERPVEVGCREVGRRGVLAHVVTPR